MPDNQNQKRSPLESLQEKLYQPGAQIGERPKAPEIFTPKEMEPERVATQWRPSEAEELMTIKQIKKKKIFFRLLALFVALVFGAAGWFGYVYFFQTFTKSDVSVRIKGPEIVESGENVKFFVTYQNRSEFNLKNAVLTFTWPSGSKSKDSATLKIEKRIGNIGAGRDATVSFEGQFFGAKNDKLAINAVLKYSPEDRNDIYEAKSSFESVVGKTPFSIVMNMPPRAVAGNEIEIFLEYQNLSETVFPNMQMIIDYPEGFSFSSAEPQPSSQNNIWEFDKIGGREMSKIKVKGTLSGRENETKLFQAKIGKSEKGEFIDYATEQYSTILSSTALLVYQTVNGSRELSVSPGDTLRYKIIYRNTTDVAIPNVVISAQLDGKAIDFKTLDVNWGSYSGATNSIIWNAGGVPQLALLSPGEEGEVTFNLRINKTVGISSGSDKNMIVASTAKVVTDQIPETLRGVPIGNEDKIEIKLNTVINLSVSGIYKNALIENSGPMPPKVGQKTTYNIVWQLTNTTNDADNAWIEATLPPHISWEGKVSPSDADISFEQATGKVVWNIGKIQAGTGFISPAKQAAFQISIIPTVADIGRSPELISESNMEATDSFTGNILSLKAEKKNIYLQEDSYIIENRGGTVVQ